ncbi:hypothetical protein [Haematospirillum jordaniae]|nr:hypothetical protein [Haematospirillum jordaniae]
MSKIHARADDIGFKLTGGESVCASLLFHGVLPVIPHRSNRS